MGFKQIISNGLIVLSSCLILLFGLEAATRTYSALYLSDA